MTLTAKMTSALDLWGMPVDVGSTSSIACAGGQAFIGGRYGILHLH